MSEILHQMNAATAPRAAENAAPRPTRLIQNYFTLLTTMMKLGLQLIWEKQNGIKHFRGIMDNEQGRELYDEIIHGVMRPEEEYTAHFSPHEIDGIAEVLSKRGMTTVKALNYLRIVIEVKKESEALMIDPQVQEPMLAFVPLMLEAPELEFRDNV